jgi:hypothetical protein
LITYLLPFDLLFVLCATKLYCIHCSLSISSDLERAQRDAAESFQELSHLRQSLDNSLRESKSFGSNLLSGAGAGTGAVGSRFAPGGGGVGVGGSNSAAATAAASLGVGSGGGRGRGAEDPLDASIAHVDELLGRFRASLLGGLASTSSYAHTHSTSAGSGGGGGGGGSNGDTSSGNYSADHLASTTATIEMNAFLAKYSDKLVDLVGEKLINKINSSK